MIRVGVIVSLMVTCAVRDGGGFGVRESVIVSDRVMVSVNILDTVSVKVPDAECVAESSCEGDDVRDDDQPKFVGEGDILLDDVAD